MFNFRSDGQNLENSARCLIPTDAFYKFTDAEPGLKRKTKWAFIMTRRDWLWIAGIVKDGAWAILTTEPGRREEVEPRLADHRHRAHSSWAA